MTPGALLDQSQRAREDQMQAFVRGLEQGKTASLGTNPTTISIIKRLVSTLGDFLVCPAGPEATESHTAGALISEPEIFSTHFNRILISSLANGCAGLQDVPIGSVLKHLMRYRHTSSILLEFLNQSDTHVAKGLAENLFRAAIDARDVVALQIVLSIPSVDPNKILCFPCTNQSHVMAPIFRAAELASLDMVKVLRKAGAIVEAFQSSRARESGFSYAKMMIESYYRDDPDIKDSSVTDIAHELLLAGFELTFKDLHEVIFTKPDMRLVRRDRQPCTSFCNDYISLLASGFAQHSHDEFFLAGNGPGPSLYSDLDRVPRCLIYGIAERLEDNQAAMDHTPRFDPYLQPGASWGLLQLPG